MSLKSVTRGGSSGSSPPAAENNEPVPPFSTTMPPSLAGRFDEAKQRLYDLDLEQILGAMEKGHRICKLALGKRWEPTYRRLCFSRESRQLMLTKTEALPKVSKPVLGKKSPQNTLFHGARENL